jgi:serine/threonine protein kinase
MHGLPNGFVFLPGTERPTVSSLVFEVRRARAAAEPAYVCKRLGPRAEGEPWMRARLVAEGALLQRLGGKGAPALRWSGEDAHGPWLVMDRADGEPLGSRAGAVDGAWTARATRAAFEALAIVHAAGAVHADVSPDNVIVADDATRAALVDFGLSLWSEAPPMPAGPFRGTLGYAAPEVARGETFGATADIFALAVTMLHVASGTAPRSQAPSPAAMLLGAGSDTIDAWATRAASSLPTHVGRTLVACCAFDAGARPESAARVIESLTRA